MSDMAEAFTRIFFEDDADEVKTWKGLALSAIMDMRRYAHDETPSRRLVSVEAYEADAVRINDEQAAPGKTCFHGTPESQVCGFCCGYK